VQPSLQWKSSITYSEFVSVALGIQHAMRHIFSCGLPALQYFSTVSHKWYDKKKLLHIKCVLISSTTFVWSISHSTKNVTRYDKKKTYIGLYVKYPLFLSEFNP